MNGNDDAYAQQMTNRDGKRLLNPIYDNGKWAKAAAACKDVMELGVTVYIQLIFGQLILSPSCNNRSSNSFRNIVTKFPEGWQNIDPFESYRSLFNGQVTAMDNPELILLAEKYHR